MSYKKLFIVGGAGFIGSHFVDCLLNDRGVERVTVFDNMSSGREWHVAAHLNDRRFSLVKGDIKEATALKDATSGHDTVIHLASNPDIAKAQSNPDIDFYQGTFLTQQVVEAARQSDVGTILYASGSGVYGDHGEKKLREQDAIGLPISTYGASKVAGEALMSAYCHMFGLRGRAFRFGNVVGPRQTHGVAFDFIRRLLRDPTKLEILGDGRQSKSYIHVDDVVEAVLIAGRAAEPTFDVFNVTSSDYISVTEIAELVVECLGLSRERVRFVYSGSDRGWKGDIPIVRLATEHICGLGWRCRRSSREAVKAAILAMIWDFGDGKM